MTRVSEGRSHKRRRSLPPAFFPWIAHYVQDTGGKTAGATLLLQQGIDAPENGRLAVRIALLGRAVQVELQAVGLAGADADLVYVGVLVDELVDSQPGLARGWGVVLVLEPALLHAGDHGVGEHRGAGALLVALGVVDQLMPDAIGVLRSEEHTSELQSLR